MSLKLDWGRVLLLLVFYLTARSSFGQVERLMYDSIPRHALDTLPVFHDYNAHMFFGYDDCKKYTALKYGFRFQYHGHLRRVSYRIMRYDWLNRHWSKQMRRRNGTHWVEAYYRELQQCQDEAVFQELISSLSDTTFARIRNIDNKAALLRVPPLQFLRYLSTTMFYSGLGPDGRSVDLEMRRDAKFLATPQDNWVTKNDVAMLIKYIYADKRQVRRACLCPDTVLPGQPATLALEAYKLIGLYRGHNYPSSFPSVSRSEIDELFRWWLRERKQL